ncbi:MAG: TolC family protein [Burkholderiaceae bacterium]|nr:TolC family protein [Burkholderiaceae bacterium]
MSIFPWLAACVVAGGLAGWPVQAQPAASPQRPAAAPPPSSTDRDARGLTLQAALESAWQRAVAARESEGQRRRVDAERAAAASLWAAPPSLALSHRDDRLHGSAGRRETDVGVSVPLWLPGQRAARAGTVEAAAAQAGAAEGLARLRLAGELREAAWQLAAAQAEAAQADAQARLLAQLAEDVDRRVQAGDLARADALAARSEQLAATSLRAELHQRLQAAHGRWVQLTGLTALPDLGASVAAHAANGMPHPELQLASQSTELARQRVALMRHSRRDPPELSVGLRQDVAGRAQASQGSLAIGLRLPLGTDDRNRPLEAAALAELDVAQTHEQRLRERLDSEAGIARMAWQSAQAQLDAETARRRLLRERSDLIDRSFRAGETPLPDLLRALAAAAQADSAVARQTAALGLAIARHQQALGLLP